MSESETPSAEERIAQLEQQVAHLTTLLERATGEAPRPHAAGTATSTEPEALPVASRRGMLKLAGATAAGAVAASLTRTLPAAANDGDPVVVGGTSATTPTTRNTTTVEYTNTATPQATGPGGTFDANIFIVRDRSTDTPSIPDSRSSYPAAIGGYSYRTVDNGLYGYTANAGYGVVGYGGSNAGAGVLARGGKANVELYPAGIAGPARTDGHNRGELICDADGNLWFCVVAGAPGTWRKIAGPTTGGAFHAIAPSRVYDSRVPEPAGNVGLLINNRTRNISLANKRDLTTGAVTTANIVPVRATAVTANVTVANTVGSGFLAINPGSDTTVGAAAINWYASNQILNNGLNLTLGGDRSVTIVCGGGGSTHVIVDVTDYFL